MHLIIRITSHPQKLVEIGKGALPVMRQLSRQLCQHIAHLLHKLPQMLILRQVIRQLKIHVSHFVNSFNRLLQQFLVGGELSVQNGAVEISLNVMQVTIGSRQEMFVCDQNQGLLLDIDCFLVTLLNNSGAWGCFFLRTNFQLFEDALLLLHEGINFTENFVDIKSSLFGLNFPFFAVAVSFKADLFCLFSERRNDTFKRFSLG